MPNYLKITADTNDADYVESTQKITAQKLEQFTPLIEAIKKFKPYKSKSKGGTNFTHSHNFPHGNGEYIPRKDLGEKSAEEYYKGVVSPEIWTDFVENYLPYGEYGIHTIVSIELLGNDERILLKK
jgi:peptidoglycan hydrolase-like amidase